MTVSQGCVSFRTEPAKNHLAVHLQQEGCWTSAQVTNSGAEAVRVHDIFLVELGPFDAKCRLYGDGFQMLSQYAGTVGESACLTPHSDKHHYRLPQDPDATTFYNLLHLGLGSDDHLLLAFASCFRFAGEFRLSADGKCRVVLNAEGLEIASGESWALEEFGILRGPDAAVLYDQLAERIVRHHPSRNLSYSPTGWCSWYCFGTNVTEAIVTDNLAAIKQQKLPLHFIQIDDGYEAHFGDWQTSSPGFPKGLAPIAEKIREAGFEPAIWLAPFIAEQGSEVLRQHPDWFIADENGKPLSSGQVSFGGWRNGPWYCLDGSHPEVQEHLEAMPKFFRDNFGCRYFKLDALFWGTMHGGRFHDPKVTRVEAFRRGMEAFNRGAGEDSYILGCNAAMWPSLGLVNGMRSTNDIIRSRETIRQLASEQFYRNWQHGKLWLNDPDCICLDEGDLTFPTPAELRQQGATPASLAEFYFHAAVILASGGVALSGDNVGSLSPDKIKLLEKLVDAPKVASRFRPFDFSEGTMTDLQGRLWRIFFNWDDAPKQLEIDRPATGSWQPLWTGNGASFHLGAAGTKSTLEIPARSAYALHT